MQVYELITCVRRANENAGNLISVFQFLINIYSLKVCAENRIWARIIGTVITAFRTAALFSLAMSKQTKKGKYLIFFMTADFFLQIYLDRNSID